MGAPDDVAVNAEVAEAAAANVNGEQPKEAGPTLDAAEDVAKGIEKLKIAKEGSEENNDGEESDEENRDYGDEEGKADDDEEEEEEVIQSIRLGGGRKNSGDACGTYTSKGPARREPNRASASAYPYSRPQQQQHPQHHASSATYMNDLDAADRFVDGSVSVDNFLDEICSDLNISLQPSEPQQPPPSRPHLTSASSNGSPPPPPAKTGIPGLPGEQQPVNKLLMNSLDEAFGKSAPSSSPNGNDVEDPLILMKHPTESEGFKGVSARGLSLLVDLANATLAVDIPRVAVPSDCVSRHARDGRLDVFVWLDPTACEDVSRIKVSAAVEVAFDQATGKQTSYLCAQICPVKLFQVMKF